MAPMGSPAGTARTMRAGQQERWSRCQVSCYGEESPTAVDSAISIAILNDVFPFFPERDLPMAKKREPENSERKKYGVTPAEFIVAYSTSETAQEVSEKLKMPVPIVVARAATYRKNGVRLKKLRRRISRRVDVAELNSLIDRLARGETPEQVLASVKTNKKG
jgi:hypothetical protein